MKWFYDLKISAKLLFAFTAVLLLTVAVGFTGFQSLTKIIPSFESMYVDRLDPAMDLADVEKAWFEVRFAVLRHYMSTDRGELGKFEQVIAQKEEEAGRLIKKYAATYLVDEEKDLLKQYEGASLAYMKSLHYTLDLSRAGDKKAAFANTTGDASAKFIALSGVTSRLLHVQGRVGKELYESSKEAATWSKILLSSVIVVAVALGLFLAFFVARVTSNPIKELNEAASRVAKGNVDVAVEVKSKDEVGNLTSSFNAMVRSIKQSQNAIQTEKAATERAARESQEAREYLQHEVSKLLEAMDALRRGDLTQTLTAMRDDDIGKLVEAYNLTVSNLNQKLHQVDQSAQIAAQSGSTISSSTTQMAAGAEEQSSQAGEVASSMEEMSKAIHENARSANEVVATAKQARDAAKHGGEVVARTVEGMQRIADVVKASSNTVQALGKSSNQIGEIVSVINDIADQTNLLALNAAIEAARAGDHGRGFAVVADEVRKLAERTTKATKEIAEMIHRIQGETKDAVKGMEEGTRQVDEGRQLAQQAGVSLHGIMEIANKVTEMITQIAGANEQQAKASEDISRNIVGISSVTSENARAIDSIARSADDLSQITTNLQALTGEFKLSSSLPFAHGRKPDVVVRSNGKLGHEEQSHGRLHFEKANQRS